MDAAGEEPIPATASCINPRSKDTASSFGQSSGVKRHGVHRFMRCHARLDRSPAQLEHIELGQVAPCPSACPDVAIKSWRQKLAEQPTLDVLSHFAIFTFKSLQPLGRHFFAQAVLNHPTQDKSFQQVPPRLLGGQASVHPLDQPRTTNRADTAAQLGLEKGRHLFGRQVIMQVLVEHSVHVRG